MFERTERQNAIHGAYILPYHHNDIQEVFVPLERRGPGERSDSCTYKDRQQSRP